MESIKEKAWQDSCWLALVRKGTDEVIRGRTGLLVYGSRSELNELLEAWKDDKEVFGQVEVRTVRLSSEGMTFTDDARVLEQADRSGSNPDATLRA